MRPRSSRNARSLRSTPRVRGDEDRRSVGRDLLDDVEDVLGHPRVEVARRLVEQHERGAAERRLGDTEQPPHPSRERVRSAVGGAGHPDPVERRDGVHLPRDEIGVELERLVELFDSDIYAFDPLNLIVVGGAINDNVSVTDPSGVIRAYDVNTGELVWNWDSGNPAETAPITHRCQGALALRAWSASPAAIVSFMPVPPPMEATRGEE